MLYQRWLQVARDHGSTAALFEAATGRQWSFADLSILADSSPKPDPPVVYPRGHSAAFVLEVLRGWRWQALVHPLELGSNPPPWPLPSGPYAHLKATSATTGAPRYILFTGPQLAADADNLVTTMGLRAGWPNLGAISMAHSYGFGNLVLPLLLHGIPLVLAPSALPEALRRAAEPFPAVTLPGVPALWRAWHEARAIPPSVRLAISAGAPLPLSLEQSVFGAVGLKIHNFYGSSECGGIAYDSSVEPRAEEACVGRPVDNVSLSLNAEGCLSVRGRAVGETYWPQAAETLRSGRFQTADLAEWRGGLLYLRGRLSDRINVAGRKLSPEVVEAALREHPLVRQCVVFGVPNVEADRAEVVAVAVDLKRSVPTEALRQFLLERLPAWQVPRAWWPIDSLAANQRGKISRGELRRRFLERPKRGQ
jgi:acyl-CoA synthetase (AMP-forming)/AMP-acid ligase II